MCWSNIHLNLAVCTYTSADREHCLSHKSARDQLNAILVEHLIEGLNSYFHHSFRSFLSKPLELVISSITDFDDNHVTFPNSAPLFLEAATNK